VAVLTIAPTAKVNDMDKNIIRPRLYHFATVGHKEEFEQLQANNKKQAERIKGLEKKCDNCVFLEADKEIINEQIEKEKILEKRIKELEAKNKRLREAGNHLYQNLSDYGHLCAPGALVFNPDQQYKEKVLEIWEEALKGKE